MSATKGEKETKSDHTTTTKMRTTEPPDKPTRLMVQGLEANLESFYGL